LWERGDRAAGDASFQAGMKLNYVEAYQAYSASLFYQNRLSEMVPIYQQAIQADPNNPNILALVSNFGAVLEKLKRFKEAEALYRETSQTTVINPTANVDFSGGSDAFNGHLRRIGGDLDTAAMALRRSIALDPKFAYPHGELGKVLQQQGKLQEAAAAYRQARSLSKDDSYLNELNVVETLLKVKK
jgi:tetratricopeptide (TPR) repeat protein